MNLSLCFDVIVIGFVLLGKLLSIYEPEELEEK